MTRQPVECDEGEQATERFTDALKAILSVSPQKAARIRAETVPGRNRDEDRIRNDG